MKKLKLIVSDFHLGKGPRLANGHINVMEDFPSDHRFEEFLEYYSTNEYENYEIELILNGDMLNMIQVDYHGHYTQVVTNNVSRTKLESIIKGHPVFFETLKRFLAHPQHLVTYIIGNHDQEMMWESTRKMFEQAVGTEILWKNTYYQVDGVHVEHGHQFEAVNRVDPTLPFLTKNLPEPILNLPWGTLFTLQYLIRIKLKRPFIDKIRPFHTMVWWSLLLDTSATITALFRLVMYFISTRFSKTRYRHSSLKMTVKMLLEASVFPDLSEAAKRILRTPEIHTVVFGHTHVYKQTILGTNKQYINTGTWTNITSMALESFAQKSKLTYVRVEYDEKGESSKAFLRHWIGRIPLEDDAANI